MAHFLKKDNHVDPPPQNLTCQKYFYLPKTISNKLIQRKEEIRLGKSGPNEIKDHPWFKDVDWEGIKALKAIPPYIPNIVFNL